MIHKLFIYYANYFIFCRLPAGYCFVEFNDEEEARRAMLRLNGKIVPGSDPVSTPAVLTGIKQEL